MQRPLFSRRLDPFLSVFLLAAVLISPSCLAEILAYDTFDDYAPDRQLFIQNSGVGLRGSWNTIFDSFERADLYQIVSPGLDGDCKVHIVADDSMNVAVRYLDQPITEGKTVFIRAAIKPYDFPADDLSEFGLDLIFEKGRALAGKGGYLSELGIAEAVSTTKAVSGTTYFLVVKVELLPGNDRLSLYNLTTLSSSEPTPIAVSTMRDFGQLQRIGFSTRNATVSYDSVVVADTFSEAVFPTISDTPTILSDQPTIIEGDRGTNDVVMNFYLTAASSRPVSVSYSTLSVDYDPNYARANEDFLPLNGVITFPPGITRQTLNLSIIGDSSAEPDESIALTLSSPVNGAFSSKLAREYPYLTIKNDDSLVVQPNLTIQQQTNRFLLQWNAGSGGNLEYTDQFPPTNGWTAGSGYVAGQTYSASVSGTNSHRFFRTRK